jgi:hypothetical protein
MAGVELGNRPGKVTAAASNAPVVVIGYAGSGAERLGLALSWFPELACTQATGILPLCHQAVTAWQAVDGRNGAGISPLAAASVRALCGGLVTAILAREGGSRWCELSSAPTAAAQTFASLYPGARYLIAHRSVDAVVRTVIGSGSWGLEGREFAPFVSAYPATPVAPWRATGPRTQLTSWNSRGPTPRLVTVSAPRTWPSTRLGSCRRSATSLPSAVGACRRRAPSMTTGMDLPARVPRPLLRGYR